MKTLILLRHAKSGWDDPVARDFDRPLNPKGQRAAAMMGLHLRDLGLRFACVLASPALRVVETIDHLAAGYGRAIEPVWDKRLYLASAGTILEVVQERAGAADEVLVVGHNPGLEELVLDLVPPGGTLRDRVEAKYPTATLAQIRFDVADWDAVRDGTGDLVRFIRPRDLDPSLGPDAA